MGNESDLVRCAAEGNLEKAKDLLGKKVDVNYANEHDATALLYAAERGHTEIAQALLTPRANVNHADERGVTPLIAASACGHTGIVKALLAAGAEVDQVDKKNDMVALTYAARYGYPDIFAELLIKGADVKHADRYGKTALDMAKLGCSSVHQLKRTVLGHPIKGEIAVVKKKGHQEVVTIINRHLFLKELGAIVKAGGAVDKEQAKQLNAYLGDFTETDITATVDHMMRAEAPQLYGDKAELMYVVGKAAKSLLSSKSIFLPKASKLSMLSDQYAHHIDKDIGNRSFGIGDKDL